MKLGDFCDVVRGSSPRPQGDPKYFGGEVPRLMIADLTRDGMIVFPKIDSLTEAGALKSRPMKKGDLIIAVSGDPGRPCILGIDACIHDGFVGLRNLNERKIWKPFLYYYLLTIKTSNRKNAVGAIFQNFTTEQIKKLEIPDVLLKDQIRIATLLSKVETLIKQRKESIDLLDAFLKSAFLKMFGDPVKNERGWQETNMNGISLQITDGEHTTPLRTESGIKLLSARNIKNGYIDFEAGLDYIGNDEYLRISKRCNPEKDDILMSCSGSVGRVSIIEVEEPLSLVRSVALIKLNKDLVNPLYIQSWMQSKHFQNEVKKGAKTSSQSNIFTGAIKKLPVLIPPIHLQTEFSNIVKKINTLKTQYQSSLKELENLFASLSQKAFKGELDLSKMEVLYEAQPFSTDNDRTKPKSAGKGKQSKNDDAGEPIVAGERLAIQIRKRYKDKHFSFEMLANFIKKEKAYDLDKYFSSEEIKANPKYDELEDLKVFLESAIVNVEMDLTQKGNPWLKLNQQFYNAEKENIRLELTKEDFALIKNRTAAERSGIYFNIVPK